MLTCAKSVHFCETQHRQVARLRSRAPDPEVELHPDAAADRRITKRDWVEIRTPDGQRPGPRRPQPKPRLGVVCGQHGWFAPCEELDPPGYPHLGPGSANLNLVLSQTPIDPISGSSPLRAQVCEITRLAPDAQVTAASTA